MTKKSILRLLQASLMCCLAVLFTACDDIFANGDNPRPAYLSIIEKPVTIKIGDTYKRTASSLSDVVIEYTSSNTNVATVDNSGLVTAIAEGTATITATATGYSSQNGKKIYQPASVSYVVTVSPATVAVTGLTLNKANLRFDKNVLTAQALIADVLPADATDKTVTWTSSDPTVATVDASGNVTPVAKGTATITAKAGDLTATSSVYVYDKIWNVNTDGAANVAGGEFWLIEGNGSEIDNAITINASPTTTITTVTLNGINITKGIECLGDATIILADGSTNTVKGKIYSPITAGIVVGPSGTTLTIDAETAGDGKLNATGGTQSAGIGTSYNYSSDITCGAITIKGGTVTATGGNGAAGIGTGLAYGSGSNTCSAIAIGTGVTSVTATRGASANSIGKGYTSGGTQNCGTITFDTVQVFDGAVWSPAPMVAGIYGGLNLAISTTTNANDTWTLTPVAP